MFDNLLTIAVEEVAQAGLTDLEDATPAQVLDAQVATADVLTALGVPSDEEIDAKLQQRSAREAFTALNYEPNTEAQKVALAQLKTPAAVQHLVGMLTEYDWEFVEQAKQLRGYTVAKIIEETKHPDARIRLAALKMLGNVTEVKLFTERVEVRQIDATEEEIEAKLKERLAKFLNPTVVQEVSVTTTPADIEAGIIDVITTHTEPAAAEPAPHPHKHHNPGEPDEPHDTL